jgi:hypothetical protein
MSRDLNTMMDRMVQIIDTTGGLDLNALVETKIQFDSTTRNSDSDTFTVDLANNRIQLHETGFYELSAQVTVSGGTANSCQLGLKAKLDGTAIPGAYGAQGFMYSPIGFVTQTPSISSFVFNNTTEDDYLEMFVDRLVTSAGTKPTFANGSFLHLKFLG